MEGYSQHSILAMLAHWRLLRRGVLRWTCFRIRCNAITSLHCSWSIETIHFWRGSWSEVRLYQSFQRTFSFQCSVHILVLFPVELVFLQKGDGLFVISKPINFISHRWGHYSRRIKLIFPFFQSQLRLRVIWIFTVS